MGKLGLCSESGSRTAKAFQFPHPPVSLSIFLTLEAALAEAWRRIHSVPRPHFNSVKALEAHFTAELHEVLVDELLESGRVPGFTKDVFQSIERPELKNLVGTHISLRPDLVARLVGRENVKATQDGIFIEAKLVNKSNGAKLRYCSQGITRFVNGSYAAAMTEAMMVAYSHDAEKPSTALAAAFSSRESVIHPIGKLKDCPQSPAVPKVAISRHERPFKVNGRAVSPITLRHLWLVRP